VEFELHFLQPVAYVCGLLLLACGVGGWDATDEDAPAMSVVGWCISGAVGGVKGDGFAAEDEWSVDLDAAKAFGGGWCGHERDSIVYKDREASGSIAVLAYCSASSDVHSRSISDVKRW